MISISRTAHEFKAKRVLWKYFVWDSHLYIQFVWKYFLNKTYWLLWHLLFYHWRFKVPREEAHNCVLSSQCPLNFFSIFRHYCFLLSSKNDPLSPLLSNSLFLSYFISLSVRKEAAIVLLHTMSCFSESFYIETMEFLVSEFPNNMFTVASIIIHDTTLSFTEPVNTEMTIRSYYWASLILTMNACAFRLSQKLTGNLFLGHVE